MNNKERIMSKSKNNNKCIIVVNGKGGIGKDTLINNLLSVSDIIPYNVSSIDPIKAKCREYWETKQKSEAYRKLLATLKKAYDEFELATNGVSFTEKYLLEKTELYMNISGEAQYVMFVHIREPENIQTYINDVAQKYPDVKVATLLVSSKRAKKSYGNEADEGVENYKYTHYFESNDSENIDSLRFAKLINSILGNDDSQYYEKFAKSCREEGICEDDIDLAISTIKGMKGRKKYDKSYDK